VGSSRLATGPCLARFDRGADFCFPFLSSLSSVSFLRRNAGDPSVLPCVRPGRMAISAKATFKAEPAS
jgi:hypothetical protein